jgi:hypothetical protein
MWLTLLSMLGGGVLRLVPFVIDIFKQKTDADHEYRMTQLQLQIDQARASQAIDLAHAQASIASAAGEMQAWSDAIKGQSENTGIHWVDAVSKTVRPFLTYYWCILLYGSAKAIQIWVAIQEHVTLSALVPILVTAFDQQVIAGMLAFWFVDRAISKMAGDI